MQTISQQLLKTMLYLANMSLFCHVRVYVAAVMFFHTTRKVSPNTHSPRPPEPRPPVSMSLHSPPRCEQEVVNFISIVIPGQILDSLSGGASDLCRQHCRRMQYVIPLYVLFPNLIFSALGLDFDCFLRYFTKDIYIIYKNVFYYVTYIQDFNALF